MPSNTLSSKDPDCMGLCLQIHWVAKILMHGSVLSNTLSSKDPDCMGLNLQIHWVAKIPIAWVCAFRYIEQRRSWLDCSKAQANYAPNFEEVEGAYLFGPVRPSVHPSVGLSVSNTFWKLRISRTPYARILKFHIWHIHEKISGPVFFFFPPSVLSFWSYAPFLTMYEQPC